jgi:hypothetical protein
MRARDFINKESLFEINMSPANLSNEAAKINAIAGMEFEMIVPMGEGPSEDERAKDMDSNPQCRSIDDIIEFFDNNDENDRTSLRRLRTRLTEEYETAVEENKEDAWEDQGFEILIDAISNGGVSEDDIADELGIDTSDEDFTGITDEQLEKFATWCWRTKSYNYDEVYSDFIDSRDELSERDFLDDAGYQRMSDVEENFDVNWPFWIVTSNKKDISEVAEEFNIFIGKPVKSSTVYHRQGIPRPSIANQYYIVEPDSSINTVDESDAGLEFVSPPMPINQILGDLQKVKKFADERGCYTDASTGLHINVSVPGFSPQNLDFVKLALLLGDDYILSLFGRQANVYCRSAMKSINYNVTKADPAVIKTMFMQMRGAMDQFASKIIHDSFTRRYSSINTHTGHIEFRSPGGDWLGKNFKFIEYTLLRFVVALDAAMDPKKYREEYLKKLYTLLAPKDNNDPLSYFAKYAAGTLTLDGLKHLVKSTQDARTRDRSRYEIVDKSDNRVVMSFSEADRMKAELHFQQWLRSRGYRHIGLTPYILRKIDPTNSTGGVQ